MRLRNVFPITVTVSALVTGPGALAQRRFNPDAPAFRADSTLVLVPVTVMNRRGAIVNGLASDAFILTEDGVRQQIRSFSEEDAPVSMGFVLDLSGSMKGLLGPAKEALRALIHDANPGDEAFLDAVSTRPRPFLGFTRNLDDALGRVAFEDARGSTALFDTIASSLLRLRSGVHPRKALVVVSDGMDNHSRYSRSELLAQAMESDARIYTLAIDTTPPFAKAVELADGKRGLLFLDELAVKTGGISFTVRSRAAVAKAAAAIGAALRDQYTIGYAPRGNDRHGQWRRIRVKVAGPGMRAYARAGYRLE